MGNEELFPCPHHSLIPGCDARWNSQCYSGLSYRTIQPRVCREFLRTGCRPIPAFLRWLWQEGMRCFPLPDASMSSPVALPIVELPQPRPPKHPQVPVPMGRGGSGRAGGDGGHGWVWQGTGEGDRRWDTGTQPGRGCRLGFAFPPGHRRHREGPGRSWDLSGTPRDEHPWNGGPTGNSTSACEPPPGSGSSQQDRGMWEMGWSLVRDGGTWRGPRSQVRARYCKGAQVGVPGPKQDPR